MEPAGKDASEKRQLGSALRVRIDDEISISKRELYQ